MVALAERDDDIDWHAQIDATIVRTHQHAAADHIKMRLDENCADEVLETIERLAGELNLDLLDLQDGTVYPPPVKTR